MHQASRWTDPHALVPAGHPTCQAASGLYTTAMCAMTLEVYYRHLPIYR